MILGEYGTLRGSRGITQRLRARGRVAARMWQAEGFEDRRIEVDWETAVDDTPTGVRASGDQRHARGALEQMNFKKNVRTKHLA